MQRSSSNLFASDLLSRLSRAGLGLLASGALLGTLALSACDGGEKDDSQSSSQDSASEESEESEEAGDSGKKKSDKDKGEKKGKRKGKGKGKGKGKNDSTKKEDKGKDTGKGEKDKKDSSTEEGDKSSSGPKDSSSKKGDSSEKEDSKKGAPIPCEGEAPTVVLETSKGRIVLALDKRAPKTVANFIEYVNDKHYDDTIFHRVLSKFMIQGGGYDTKDKEKKTRAPIKLETHPDLKHKAGALAMARTNVKDSATAQFYICVDDSGCKHLDGEYAVFGFATEGIDVVKTISEVPKSQAGKPNKNVLLTKAYCIKP